MALLGVFSTSVSLCEVSMEAATPGLRCSITLHCAIRDVQGAWEYRVVREKASAIHFCQVPFECRHGKSDRDGSREAPQRHRDIKPCPVACSRVAFKPNVIQCQFRNLEIGVEATPMHPRVVVTERTAGQPCGGY